MADRFQCRCIECDYSYNYTNGGLKMGAVSSYFCFECLNVTAHFASLNRFGFKEVKYEHKPPRYLTYFFSAIRKLKHDLLESQPELVEKTLKDIYKRYDPSEDEVYEAQNEIEFKYFDHANSDYDEALSKYNRDRLKAIVESKKKKDLTCKICSNENIFEMYNRNCPLCGGKPEIKSRALLD